jgi:hypothetical protein
MFRDYGKQLRLASTVGEIRNGEKLNKYAFMKKFIVYLTINTKNRKIYVGVHQTDKPYEFDGYIGNGVYAGYPTSRVQGSKIPFHMAVIKYGVGSFERITLGIFDSVEKAYNQEALIVTEQFVARKDTYNVALGGVITTKPSRKVLQYSREGFYIKTWESVQEVATTLKYSTSAIQAVCIGTNITACGYQWRYTEFEGTEEVYKKIPSVLNRTGSTRIAQYKLDGSFITVWKSANVAGKEFETKGEVLVRNAEFGKQWKGYQWRVLVEDIPEPLIEEFVSSKAIAQLDSEFNILRVWNSKADIKAAGYNNITRALSKTTVTMSGFHWMRLIDYREYKKRI